MLALARSARAVECDGFLKHRARQVQMVVMRQASEAKGRSASQYSTRLIASPGNRSTAEPPYPCVTCRCPSHRVV